MTEQEIEKIRNEAFNQGLIVGLTYPNKTLMLEVDFTKSLVSNYPVEVLSNTVIKGVVFAEIE